MELAALGPVAATECREVHSVGLGSVLVMAGYHCWTVGPPSMRSELYGAALPDGLDGLYASGPSVGSCLCRLELLTWYVVLDSCLPPRRSGWDDSVDVTGSVGTCRIYMTVGMPFDDEYCCPSEVRVLWLALLRDVVTISSLSMRGSRVRDATGSRTVDADRDLTSTGSA